MKERGLLSLKAPWFLNRWDVVQKNGLWAQCGSAQRNKTFEGESEVIITKKNNDKSSYFCQALFTQERCLRHENETNPPVKVKQVLTQRDDRKLNTIRSKEKKGGKFTLFYQTAFREKKRWSFLFLSESVTSERRIIRSPGWIRISFALKEEPSYFSFLFSQQIAARKIARAQRGQGKTIGQPNKARHTRTCKLAETFASELHNWTSHMPYTI